MGVAPELWVKAEIVRGESAEVCLLLKRLETVPVVSACGSKGIVGLERRVSYPYLRGTIGSTFIARRAGMEQAASATSVSSSATPVNVSGSVALTPKSSERIHRVQFPVRLRPALYQRASGR